MKIKYHFFGKDCIIDRALSDRVNLAQKLENISFKHDQILLLNQIHGKEVVIIDDEKKIYGAQNLPKADAIITNLRNVVIGVVTADCSPILFIDEEKNIIAAVHAGWRGARLDVMKLTIEAMKKMGAKNIKAKIGPMIQQKSYEVSKDFFDDFLNEDLANKDFFVNSAKAQHHMFDLPSYIEKKLREENIEIENLRVDTYENEEKFFSYRRSTHKGEKDCGRNLSVIVIN